MTDTNQRPPPPGKAESLFAAWAARIEAGEQIEFESVVRRHPECARELEQLHDDWLQFAPLLSRVVPGLVASESGVLVPPLASAKDDDAPPSSDELFARLGLHGAGESRYRFRAVIGRGGGGVVLRVWDSKLNRALAMKVVLGREEERLSGDTPRVDGRTLSRFVDEARIAAQLNHPGIVPVHELGADDAGRAFFTMKLVKGEDLARIFEKVFTGEGDWNQPRALGYLLRVCEAMAYAHDKGVVHRDLKPANVMVGPYGEVHVMDWGLARVLGEKDTRDLRIRPQPQPPISAVDSFRAGERKAQADSPLITMDGAAVGTPAYMSPEQARGELEDVGPRSDVYAVGAMLYHLLTGEPPFTPRGAHVPQLVVLTNVMHGPPKPVEELSPRAAPELVAICEKAMQRQSTHRYGSMLELAADLRAFLEGRVVEAYETGTWAETKKLVQRNKALAGSLLVTGLTIAALVFVLIRQASSDRRARVEAEQSATRERDAKAVAQANEQRAKQAEVDAKAAEERAVEAAQAAEEDAYVAAIAGARAARNSNEPATVRRLLDSAPKRLRNWEWGYLNALSDTSLLTLEGYSPNWSPDGTLIVTVLDDFTAQVWDASSGRERAKLVGHTEYIHRATFSLDGTRVVTASADDTARVWDAASGRELARLEGHIDDVTSASFSSDGLRVVTASKDMFARLWDAGSGKELASLEKHEGAVKSAGFDADGTRVLTVSVDGIARLWDTETGRQLAEFECNRGWISGACLSPDGTRVLTADGDCSARIWDAASGDLLATLQGHADLILVADFSPDGRRVVTASVDNSARIWDVATGLEIAALRGHTQDVHGASFSRDGTRIATTSIDDSTRVWDAATGRELAKLDGHTGWGSDSTSISKGHEFFPAESGVLEQRPFGQTGAVFGPSFSSDGTKVVATSGDGSVRVWEVASGPQRMSLAGHEDRVYSASFSADGTRLLTVSDDGAAFVWDAISGAELAKLDGQWGYVRSASFSRDGARIVIACGDDSARVLDATTGLELVKLEGQQRSVSRAYFSPDGARVLTTSVDGSASVWDAINGRVLMQIPGDTGVVHTGSFSADGTRIVSVAPDGSVRTWDALSGRGPESFGPDIRGVNSARFSPDGTRVIRMPGDRNVRIVDTASGRELAKLVGHTGRVHSAAFSPDGSRVITASEDGTARVWDAASGREMARLEGHTSAVNSASFSSDAARLVTASDDGSASVWDSVPYRVRHSERQTVEAARPEGVRRLSEALAEAGDFVLTAARLRNDATLDPLVRSVALNMLSERCNRARENARALDRARADRQWNQYMLGLRPSGAESEKTAVRDPETTVSTRADELHVLAWRLRDSGGQYLNALALAEQAGAHVWMRGGLINMYRSGLARSLFRLRRFDEALVEQRRALSEASSGEKAEYQAQLEQLEAEIAEWRDENGQLRVAKWTAKLEELDRQIAELEADPDVRMWLAYKR